MPKITATPALSRRERQIMDLLFRDGTLTALQIQEALPDAPSYSAVRGLLRILLEKGHVKHQEQGPRYAYTASLPKDKASHSAVAHLVETFFSGSVSDTVAALLHSSANKLDAEELRRIQRMIEKAKKEGR